MTITIIEGPTGSGKTLLAAEQCLKALDNGLPSSSKTITPIKTMAYYTSVSTYGNNDNALKQLIAIENAYPQFSLLNPVKLSSITPQRYWNIVFDEILFNPSGGESIIAQPVGYSVEGLYTVNEQEFSIAQLGEFIGKAVKFKTDLTFVTSNYPKIWADAIEKIARRSIRHFQVIDRQLKAVVMMRAHVCRAILTLAVLLLFTAQNARAQLEFPVVGEGAISTDEIIDISLKAMAYPDCLEYCVVGICILYVPPYSIEVVPRVSHYLPDLVVSTHLHPGESAWSEMAELQIIPARAAVQAFAALFGYENIVDGGKNITRNESGQDMKKDQSPKARRTKHVFNGDVDIWGNPALLIIDRIADSTDYICPSETDAFYPYYQSELDLVNWRFGFSELLYPESYLPGTREIGEEKGIGDFTLTVNTWGSVMPRISSVMAHEPPMGAGVLAQRGVDIVTRDDQPRIYTQVDGLAPSDETKDKWMMMRPFEDGTCAPFGSSDPLYSTGRYPDDHKYSYLYWGNHECCAGKGIIIAVIYTTPVCV